VKVYLISNNLVVQNISYESDDSLEQKRINRPLSIEGEQKSEKLGKVLDIDAIYSSNYASAISTAKYLSREKDLPIYIDAALADAKIGDPGKYNIKMLRYMQERNFDYKFPEGESLNETRIRIAKSIDKILLKEECDVAIFTHKRAILSYLTGITKQGFNLDSRLLLTYNDCAIIDDTEKDLDIIAIEFANKKIVDITALDL